MDFRGINIGYILDLVLTANVKLFTVMVVLSYSSAAYVLCSLFYFIASALSSVAPEQMAYLSFTRDFQIRVTENTIVLPSIVVFFITAALYARSIRVASSLEDYFRFLVLPLLTYLVIPLVNILAATYNAIISRSSTDLISLLQKYSFASNAGFLATGVASTVTLLYKTYPSVVYATVVLYAGALPLAFAAFCVLLIRTFYAVAPVFFLAAWSRMLMFRITKKDRPQIWLSFSHTAVVIFLVIIPVFIVLLGFLVRVHFLMNAEILSIFYQYATNPLAKMLVESLIDSFFPEDEDLPSVLGFDPRAIAKATYQANCDPEASGDPLACSKVLGHAVGLCVLEFLIAIFIASIARFAWRALRRSFAFEQLQETEEISSEDEI